MEVVEFVEDKDVIMDCSGGEGDDSSMDEDESSESESSES
jgi:hypothetical protein